ncbi:MAG: ABC transporter ATP-binding protein, partial [Bacilli bacterium]|nr:ABC transporter ATP-binding protein [Bacilli bacterium]
MALLEIKNLSFKYPLEDKYALENISLTISEGDFLLVCGKTGCGKTTLLKLMKKELMPNGAKTGQVLFMGNSIDNNDQPQSIGYVFQNPDNQIVTDKVWHELSFGLENLNTKVEVMNNRIAEIANFFGIDNWFYDKTANLSGGQKQILNLASVLVMNPKVILLDEPTSQLDPIARSNFLALLTKINQELGITIVLVEHNLEDVFGIVDEVLLLDSGRLLIKGLKEEVNYYIRKNNLDIREALPSALQITNSLNLKVSYFVKDARQALINNYFNVNCKMSYKVPILSEDTVIDCKNIFYSYDRKKQDILNNLNIKVLKGEILTVLGSNGSGKTTLLNVISGVIKPYSGRIFINSKKIKEYKNNSLYINNLTVLPQNPLNVFLKKRVIDDLNDSLLIGGSSEEDKNKIIDIFQLKSYLY